MNVNLEEKLLKKKCKTCENIVFAKKYVSMIFCEKCVENGNKSLFFKKRNEKTTKTLLIKYGVKNNFLIKDENGIHKRKKAYLKKYGVDSPLKSEKIKKQVKKTNLKKYGFENPFQDVEKLKSIWLKKYGFTNPNKNLSVRKKIETTNLKKYGVKAPIQNKEIREKLELTSLKRYGDRQHLRSPEIMKKRFNHPSKFCFTKPHKILKDELNKLSSNFESEGFLKIENRTFSIDEIDRKNKIIIFVDGDYWHANPEKFNDEDIMANGKTAKFIRKNDKQITNILERNGYKVLRFWENDIYNNFDSIKDHLINLLVKN